MNGDAFLNKLANGKIDVVQLLLDKLKGQEINYCIIGGLAVNTYTDPIASLDIDLVLAVDNSEEFLEHIKNVFQISKFPHSIN